MNDPWNPIPPLGDWEDVNYNFSIVQGEGNIQIALTKKSADAIGVNYPSAHEDENPLFSWSANWTKAWDNRRAEDMLILVNNATCFTVAIYQVKRCSRFPAKSNELL